MGGATEDVAENIDTAFVIYTINVDDEDNEVVTTTMTQSPGEKFKLTANEVKLNTGQALDFENDPHEYTLSFTYVLSTFFHQSPDMNENYLEVYDLFNSFSVILVHEGIREL